LTPANLKNPFGESCCDGGICDINDRSARPCGCDPGANWVCERHKYGWKPVDKMGLEIRGDEPVEVEDDSRK